MQSGVSAEPTLTLSIISVPAGKLRQEISSSDLEGSLSALIREGSWYLGNEGLTVFSSVYEIASYAAGVIDFTFSYDEIAPYIDARWLPAEYSGSGELEAL